MVVRWGGTWPKKCDFCRTPLEDEKYFADARDNHGRWGLFCPECHKNHCNDRTGVGSGQLYDAQTLVKFRG